METLTWLVPDRVLYWKFTNGSTTTEFQSGLEEVITILEKAEKQVHIIIDARMAQSLVGSTLMASLTARKVARHPQMGCCLVISHNFMFKHQLNRVTVAFGTHLRYSDSFRYAWQSLHHMDRSLPYVAPNLPVIKPQRMRQYA